MPFQNSQCRNSRTEPITAGTASSFLVSLLILGFSSRGIGSSGGSSESESSWGSGTVSFIEPSYRPSNLSVGSRGHLKIDYSCSWNRLDDFVRTTSPKDGCYGCSEDYRMHYGSRSPREYPASACMTAPAALLLPWERYSDTAAG